MPPRLQGTDHTGSCRYKVQLQYSQIELFLLSVKIFQAMISFLVMSLLIPLQPRHTKCTLVKGMFKKNVLLFKRNSIYRRLVSNLSQKRVLNEHDSGLFQMKMKCLRRVIKVLQAMGRARD